MKKTPKKKKAMTLVEIMVAIAVIAVMVILGIFGANTLQRNSRNSTRKNTLSEISNQINAFKLNSTLNNYPNNSDVSFNSNVFEILNSGQATVNLKGASVASSTTTSTTTKYFYDKSSGGYKLCARLEGGGIENAGTVKCTSLDI
jgi:type II secretory pathway pseudopilin PulG